MKVTFVVPELNLTGGLRVVSIYANTLSQRGHSVNVLYASPRKPTWKQRIKKFLTQSKSKKLPNPYFEYSAANIKEINFWGDYDIDDLPDSDVIIATFWVTAEWIEKLPMRKGVKVYLLQHYELHPWLPIERVKATFKYDFKKIVVSEWIRDCLEKNENCKVDHLVLNGVDPVQFNAEPRKKNDNLTVGFMYSSREFKGSDIAVEAIRMAKTELPELNLIVLAFEEPKTEFFKQNFIKVYVRPEQAELRKIYAECDAWIFSSRKEGFGLPILEAMACRTPVIGTPTGAATSVITKDNGILLESFDSHALTEAIIKMKALSNNEWQNMSESAYLHSNQYSWQNSSDALEEALKAYINEPKNY